MDPIVFFEKYVRPAVKDWRADKASERRAIAAIVALDNLAEHHINANAPTPKPKWHVTSERNKLSASNRSLGLARDIHDTHKHGELYRENSAIKGGQPPVRVNRHGLIMGRRPIGRSFIGAPSTVEFVLDGGERVAASSVIEGALDHWCATLPIADRP